MPDLQQFDSDVDEGEAWEAFEKDGGFVVKFGNGLVETVDGIGIFMEVDDIDGGKEWNFGAGYRVGGYLSDFMNIPASVFSNVVDDELPEGVSIDWNGSESTHWVEGGTFKAVMPIVVPALVALGFTPEPDLVKALPKAKVVAKKPKEAGLKSADHVEAIIALVAEDRTVQDFVWDQHRNDEDYDEVRLPDRASSLGGGMVMIEQGRKDWVPNGKLLYQTEADFWAHVAKHFKHWPKLPLTRKSNWTREYRKKVGDAIERRFDLFVYPIYAITREQEGRITSIEIHGEMGFDRDLDAKPNILLKQKDFS